MIYQSRLAEGEHPLGDHRDRDASGRVVWTNRSWQWIRYALSTFCPSESYPMSSRSGFNTINFTSLHCFNGVVPLTVTIEVWCFHQEFLLVLSPARKRHKSNEQTTGLN